MVVHICFSPSSKKHSISTPRRGKQGEETLFAGALAVQTGGNAHTVFQTGQDVLQIFLHGLGAARQVDDERFAAQHADCRG